MAQAPGGPDEDPEGGFAFGGWQAPLSDETVGNIRLLAPVTTSPRGVLLQRCERLGGTPEVGTMSADDERG